MAPTITRIDVAGSAILGEGPHWDPKTKSLYFVDIDGGTIHRYCSDSNTACKATIEGYDGCHIALIIPIKDQSNKFVIALNRTLGICSWDGKSTTATFVPIAEVDSAPELATNRINDGKCDALGRIWFGTIGIPKTLSPQERVFPKQASFYTFHAGELICQFEGVCISNGLTWNKANTKFYYIDTSTNYILEFDFDLTSGTIKNRKILIEFAKNGIKGGPDGMTIDTEDNLWVAMFDGNCIVQISSKNGSILQKLDLPAQVTSVAWGGDNLDELYVTSARAFNPELKGPVHGALYRITNLGFKGFLMNEVIL